MRVFNASRSRQTGFGRVRLRYYLRQLHTLEGIDAVEIFAPFLG